MPVHIMLEISTTTNLTLEALNILSQQKKKVSNETFVVNLTVTKL